MDDQRENTWTENINDKEERREAKKEWKVPACEIGGNPKGGGGEDASPEKQDAAASELLGPVEQLAVDEVDVGDEDGDKDGEEEGEAEKL